MLVPITKPWAGVSRDFRTYRTEDTLDYGVFEKPVEQLSPTAGIIGFIVMVPEAMMLKAMHVANRFAHIVAIDNGQEWLAFEGVIKDTLEKLAKLHGLSRKEQHHVAGAHSGRSFAHPSHVTEDMFAEYLLTGKVSLHDSGGVVRVDDGRRKYTAYAQPGHKDESKETLANFQGHFLTAVHVLMDSLEGRILVA